MLWATVGFMSMNRTTCRRSRFNRRGLFRHLCCLLWQSFGPQITLLERRFITLIIIDRSRYDGYDPRLLLALCGKRAVPLPLHGRATRTFNVAPGLDIKNLFREAIRPNYDF